MQKYLLPGLVTNAMTLGIHWIYDYQFLKKESLKSSLLFRIQNKEFYDQAKNAYYTYPNQKLGDVTVQGNIMIWLYEALKENPSFNMEQYEKMLFDHFKPGGQYIGYVESYIQKLIYMNIAKNQNLAYEDIELSDNHLIGFIPYLVCKELNLSNDKAWEFAQLFANDTNYVLFYQYFDHIIEQMSTFDMAESIDRSIQLVPNIYLNSIKKAMEIEDTDLFIEQYAGRECAIQSSIPVIIHILYHSKSYEDAVLKNALIGGAISDRGTLIGAIYNQKQLIEKSYYDQIENGQISRFIYKNQY